MKTDDEFQEKMNNRIIQSETTDMSSNKRLPDWNRLYTEMRVEDMPWYLPELDPDLEEALDKFIIKTGSFLDLGTGPGTQAIELSKRGFDVTGIDISKDAILNARKLNEQVKFVQDDILKTHIQSQYNYIFDRGCFHIIDEEKRPVYLNNVLKLLKNEGIIFLKCFSDKNTFTGFGPHHISRPMIHELFNRYFDILKIKDSTYQSVSSQQNKTLFVVMKKRNNKQN
jgi:SAM-dependent methyltransferase